MTKRSTRGYTAAPTKPLFYNGIKARTVLAVIDPTNHALGDVIVLARNLPLGVQVLAIRHEGVPSNAGCSNLDIGFHRADNDVVIDKDILVDGADLSSAIAYGQDLMVSKPGTGTDIQTIGDMLDLDPDQEPAGGVNLTATWNSEPTGTSYIKLFIDLAYPA